MPPSLHDWVDPEGLPAFLNDLVDELDRAPFIVARHVPARIDPPAVPLPAFRSSAGWAPVLPAIADAGS